MIWAVGLFIQGPCLVNSEIDIINEILGECWNGDMLVVIVDQDQFAVSMLDDVFEELGFLEYASRECWSIVLRRIVNRR